MKYEEALRKAMACLRLAKSTNQAEAALAAAKAQEIITRYGLNVQDADFEQEDKAKDNEDIKYFGTDDPVDAVPRSERGWALRLLSVVARVNCCKCYQQPNYDGKGGKKLMIMGRPSDVQTARYFYGWLKAETNRLCELNTKGNSGVYKAHYCLGVVDAIGEKLRQQKTETVTAIKTENANNSLALVRINAALARQEQRQAGLTAFAESFEKKNGFGRAHASGFTQTNTGGRAHGQRDGRNIRIGAAKGGLTTGSKQLN